MEVVSNPSALFMIICLAAYACGALLSRGPMAGSSSVRILLPAQVALVAAVAALWPYASSHNSATASATLVSLDILSKLMLILISFIGLIIVRYSLTYLQGEPGRNRYFSVLFMVLASVAVVVTSNHLLTLWLGWVAISLGLHSLLRFYPDRPRAALAAHKKFLFARVAELALLIAFALLAIRHGSWHIDTIMAQTAANGAGVTGHLAAMLIALAALIKCAQLPVHGWLMQVVEAPTPVSALLHAGVVNMGGFLLLRFGPLVVQSALAQALLLLVAGISAATAALAMTTRVSIKVKLAWSTCAQMGFMLIECALGLFDLALLHLLAHSCYKAHAFLNAGSAVGAYVVGKKAPATTPVRRTWFVAIAIGGALSGGTYLLLGAHGLVSIWVLLALALATVIAERSSRLGAGGFPEFLMLAGAVLGLYIVQKLIFGQLLPASATISLVWADAWLSPLFIAMFIGHIVLRHYNHTAFGTWLWQRLFAGLYLDEWATRVTLKLLPTSLPVQSKAGQPFKGLPNEVTE